MQIQSLDLNKLPYSSLFKTYLKEFSAVDSLFEGTPYSLETYIKRINALEYSGNREVLVNLLKEFNNSFIPTPRVLSNIDALRNPEVVTIVTGQQAGVFGGPLYTIYKIITTLSLCKKVQEASGKTVVPVFWIADEDHDYDEIAQIGIPTRDAFITEQLLDNRKVYGPVALQRLPTDIERLLNSLSAHLQPSEFKSDVVQLLKQAYKPDNTHGLAFGTLIMKLFGPHGLVLAGSNQKAIKDFVKPVLKTAISEADNLKMTLEKQSAQVETRFERQAHIGSTTLFYLSKTGERLKFDIKNGMWFINDSESWSTDQLLDECDHHPERFSPNVFLRPVVQDFLLPNIAYVAGPGEVAYYAQLKSFYKLFNMKMPVIVPRMTGTILESNIVRYIKELPHEIPDYLKRIEDVISAYITKSDNADVHTFTTVWSDEINAMIDSRESFITALDPTLKGTLESVRKEQLNAVGKLHQKIQRALKQKEEVNIRRIEQICLSIYPEMTLQERNVSFIYIMNKYGTDVWDKLLALVDPLNPDHQLVYI